MRCERKEIEYDIIWFHKYQIIRVLGQGGSGTVFLAHHTALNVERAIKRIPRESTGAQWMNEVQVLKLIRHDTIPVIYDLEEDEHYIYIIEEYIKGQSLRAYRLSHHTIQEAQLYDYSLQLCSVLEFLHSMNPPILYLDLKPDNLLITEDGQLKLIDFGTAAIVTEPGNTSVRYGTKSYAAPEQLRQNRVDERSDIYGIGEIMHYMAFGCAYDGNPVRLKARRKHVMFSTHFFEIMERCLCENPMHRYASVETLGKEIERLREGFHKKDTFGQTPHIITVAGSMERIGTTHACFMLASCLRGMGISTLYVEQNRKRVIEFLYAQEGAIRDIMVARGSIADVMRRYPDFQAYVCDCGWIEDGKAAYEAGNKRFFVIGGKPWEQTERRPDADEIVLVNFASPRQLAEQREALKPCSCHEIPYLPDPLLLHKDKSIYKEVKKLLHDLPKKKQRRKPAQKKYWFS